MRDYFVQWHPQEIWKFSLLNLVKTFKDKRPKFSMAQISRWSFPKCKNNKKS